MRLRLPFIFSLLLVAMVPAQAQESFLPAGRAIVKQGVDFYGADIRSIFDTSIEICRDACEGDVSCKAFTFNANAGACFLKSEHGEESPFEGAQSAELIRPDPALTAQAISRAADLSFASSYLPSARDYAKSIAFTYPVNDFTVEDLLSGAETYKTEGNYEQAFWNVITVANMTDSSRDWLDASHLLVQAATQKPDFAADYQWQARSAAINAYLRADDLLLQAQALNQIATLM